jgi:RNA polymerase sigma-70 factor (ECF subfamily)
MSESTTVHLERCLQCLQADDEVARTELLGFASRRLKQLANQMFFRFPRLHGYEQADDLFQEGMVRLWSSLKDVGPTNVAGFMGLAALQMRRSLCDMARKHFGREPGSSRASSATRLTGLARLQSQMTLIDDVSNAPEMMMYWAEFHTAADELPELERRAFDLLYYGELPQLEAAELMGVTDRQLRRYWQSARLMIGKKLDGFRPEDSHDG